MPGLKPGFGRLATVAEALDVLHAHRPVMGAETVKLEEALHRVLSRDVVSEIDVPQFHRAAMDGYAVRAVDTFGAGDGAPKTLQVVGALSPGSVWSGVVTQGTCLEIGTGSVMPEGADAVVMVEYTEPAGPSQVGVRQVRVRKGAVPGGNVIDPASDIQKGDVVLGAGALIGPSQLGALAAIGRPSVEVATRPRVALLSTGPELVEPGRSLGPGQIYDINSYTLRAALVADGFLISDTGSVPDQADPLKAAIRAGLAESDVVVVSGGSSLGGSDLVVEVFESLGRVLIHGVAVKPGKPLVVAVSDVDGDHEEGAGKLMIGLPGYPMSALCDYYVFVRPCLRAAQGRISRGRFTDVTLARKHASVLGRYEFVPVRLDGGRAHPLTKGSSSITALAAADGFIEVHENTEVLDEGESVRVALL
ncbi:MAG: molybdopterin-binding protein [Actinomycetota bacterium]